MMWEPTTLPVLRRMRKMVPTLLRAPSKTWSSSEGSPEDLSSFHWHGTWNDILSLGPSLAEWDFQRASAPAQHSPKLWANSKPRKFNLQIFWIEICPHYFKICLHLLNANPCSNLRKHKQRNNFSVFPVYCNLPSPAILGIVLLCILPGMIGSMGSKDSLCPAWTWLFFYVGMLSIKAWGRGGKHGAALWWAWRRESTGEKCVHMPGRRGEEDRGGQAVRLHEQGTLPAPRTLWTAFAKQRETPE